MRSISAMASSSVARTRLTLLGYVGHWEVHEAFAHGTRVSALWEPRECLKSAASEGECTAEGIDVSLRQRVQWLHQIVQAVQ
jgi:hypothetical protein